MSDPGRGSVETTDLATTVERGCMQTIPCPLWRTRHPARRMDMVGQQGEASYRPLRQWLADQDPWN